MKIFKKTVAMFIALATLCSLCVFATAATEYSDEKAITNKEAVTVLSELEVLQGDSNGFRPADGLIRAEGCAIIARLFGQDDYPGVSGFNDMQESAWAEGVVAFCKDMGIVSGTGNGCFSPKDPLTGAAFGKMLLTSLGYDAIAEGLIGSAWVGNVTRLCKQIKLLENLPYFNANYPICREDAAQMALNALQATMVEYSSGARMTSGDVSMTINGSRSYMPAIGKDFRGNEYNNTCEFCEYYFEDLKLKTSDLEGFGRPSHNQWTLNGKVIYNLESEDALLEQYSDGVKTGELYDLIGKDAYEAIRKGNADLTVFIDGTEVSVALKDYFVKNGSKNAAFSGNGILTEVYMDEDYNVTIIQIGTYLAQATEDYDEDKDELAISVFGNSDVSSAVLYGEELDVEDYEMEDWLLVRFDNGEVVSVEPAETVSGKLKGYTVGKSVNVDSGAYEYAALFDTDCFAQGDFAVNSDMTLVLDDNGYILGLKAKQAQNNQYIYVIEIARGSSFAYSGFIASGIQADGKYTEVAVKSVDGREPATTDCGWFTFKQNVAGYVLTTATNVLEEEGTDISVKDNKVQFLYDDTASDYIRTFRATSETVFTVIDTAGNINSYIGYTKTPAVNAAHDQSIKVSAFCDDNGFARSVIIDAGTATVTAEQATLGDLIFVADDNYTVSGDADGNTFYTYPVIFKGNKTTAKFNALVTDAGLYGNLIEDENGYLDVSSMQAVSDSEDGFSATAVADDEISLVPGILTVKSDCYVTADTCKAFTVNENGEISSCTVSQLVNRARTYGADIVCGVFTSGKVVTLIAVIDTSAPV